MRIKLIILVNLKASFKIESKNQVDQQVDLRPKAADFMAIHNLSFSSQLYFHF